MTLDRGTIKAIVALLGAALILIAGFVGVALANNGPHGVYLRFTTPKCAVCHRAHTAVGETLLREATIYALCTSCHSNGGASTNVLLGMGGGGARLNGGGFQSITVLNPDTGEIVSQPVTSAHNVKGLDGGSGIGTAWGGASSGTGVQGVLECISCHNPHGSTNYRILRDADNGYPYDNAAAHRWIPDDPNLLDWQDRQVLPTVDPGGIPGNRDNFNYIAGDYAYYTGGMRNFCATCHKSYLTRSGSARNPSTDPAFYYYPGTQDANDGKDDVARYRHATSRQYTNTSGKVLRFAASFPSATTRYEFVCTTCHFAHGTSAAATGFAANVAPTNDSALLYYNNRGVCRECHWQNK